MKYGRTIGRYVRIKLKDLPEKLQCPALLAFKMFTFGIMSVNLMKKLFNLYFMITTGMKPA